MLKPEMIEKLNEQMNLELYSSLLYQQMSAWCSYHTFEGAAAFLRRHAQAASPPFRIWFIPLPTLWIAGAI